MSTPLLIALIYVVSFAVFVSCGFWLVRRYWSNDEREFSTIRVLALVVGTVVVLDIIGTLLFFVLAAWVA
ncbi:MAG TPA: hypothetical protein VFL61_14925 [Gaiellaceae bacterium]|nr:hypothetical protein [Gaiellaceae bacterium]